MPLSGKVEAGQQSGNVSDGKLGTFAGVFTPSLLTILGLVLFLRLGYVVGELGLARALLAIMLANAISILTSLSLAAIATNLKIKAGGDYYLISRTLGIGYGGAIGLVLFLAQSVSIGFYCVGFGEAAAVLLGFQQGAVAQGFASLAVAGLFALAWKGSDWATRFQYVIMGLLVAALLSFSIGAWPQMDSSIGSANLWRAEGSVPFWAVFAVFFPAVTGFTQGVSMSGDLRSPARSLPLGTFLAVGISMVVYFGVALLLAGTQPLDTLRSDYGAMKLDAAAPWLIDVGIFAATLSSGLASFMGAPRILQSLAKDRVFPLLRWFARGAGPQENPRRGVVLAGLIALATIALGNLNLIAGVVSMFFLASYGLLNYATYFEAQAASPSFRPTFRWYHPKASLAGVIACAAVMLAIDPLAALAALAILAAIFQYLKLRGASARWADNRRSHDLQRARVHLLSAASRPAHARDWRPYILAFSDSPTRRKRLLRVASWIEGSSGMTTVVRVIEGHGVGMLKRREDEQKALADEIRAHGSTAFPLVVVAPSVDAALPTLVQATGAGPILTNTVLSNWIEAPTGVAGQWYSERYGQNLRTAFRLGCNLLVLDAEKSEWEALDKVPPGDRVIDVWWNADKTGELTLLLAYLMTRSPEWRDAEIRVLVAERDNAPAPSVDKLRELLATLRVDAEPIIVRAASSASIAEHSSKASIVFLSFAIRSSGFVGPFGGALDQVLPGLPVVVLVMAADDVDLGADPDEGEAKERSAVRDAFEDATRSLAHVRGTIGKLDAAAAEVEKRTQSARTSGADPAALAALEAELADLRQKSSEAARRAAKFLAKRDDAVRAADAMGLALPRKGTDA